MSFGLAGVLHSAFGALNHAKRGAFVWDKSGIRITGIMQVSVRLAALPIPEYLDFHSGYSAPSSLSSVSQII